MTDHPISVIPLPDLPGRLGFSEPISHPQIPLVKSFVDWKMEEDDSPIFRYIYRNSPIHRHLEFGTWQGMGVLYCLEETDATVWTINLLEGEESVSGDWAYSQTFDASDSVPVSSNSKTFLDEMDRPIIWHQTDAYGFIGRLYKEKNLGSRVCQIYCDSREWDISQFPSGFFDSALIDGGHTEEIVISDTRKALRLVRPGGIIMWHDFCPVEEVIESCSSTRGVFNAIYHHQAEIAAKLQDFFWIKPSWILAGIVAESPDSSLSGPAEWPRSFSHENPDLGERVNMQPNEELDWERLAGISLRAEQKENSSARHQLRTKMRDQEKKLGQLSRELQQRNEELQQSGTALSEKIRENELLRSEQQSIHDTIGTLQCELARKQQQIDDMRESFAQYEARFESFIEDSQKTGQLMGNLQSSLQQKEEKIREADSSLSSLQEQISELQNRTFEKDQLAAALQAQLTDRNEQLQSLRAELSKTSEELENLRAALASRDTEIELLRADNAQQKQEMQILSTDNGQQEKHINLLQDEINEKDKQMQSQRAELSKASEDIIQVHADLAQRDRDIELLRADNAQQEKSINLLRDEIAERDKLLNSADTTRTRLETEIAALREENDGQASSIQSLNEALAHKTQHVAERDGHIQSLNETLARQQQIEADLRGEIEAIHAKPWYRFISKWA
jgi:chromosome segregation ATPase